MARIPMLRGTFKLMPEGTHVLRIAEVDYKEAFGKLAITYINADGITLKENYSLLKQTGEPNEGALRAFSYLCSMALQDNDLEDVDPQELVNHYITATIVHTSQPNRNDPTKTVTFANITDRSEADGFTAQITDPKAVTFGTPDPQYCAQPVPTQPAPTQPVTASPLSYLK